jgi:hypothetical protein
MNTRLELEGSPCHSQRTGLAHARRSPSCDARSAAPALDGEVMMWHKGKGPHRQRLDGGGMDGRLGGDLRGKMEVR